MSVIQVSNYHAERIPSRKADEAGIGRILLRNAANPSELHWLSNINGGDFHNLLTLLQTEKPRYVDTLNNAPRTAYPQSLDAERVEEQTGQ